MGGKLRLEETLFRDFRIDLLKAHFPKDRPPRRGSSRENYEIRLNQNEGIRISKRICYN